MLGDDTATTTAPVADGRAARSLSTTIEHAEKHVAAILLSPSLNRHRSAYSGKRPLFAAT